MIEMDPFDSSEIFDVIRERLGDFYSVEQSNDSSGVCGIKIKAQRDGQYIEVVSPGFPTRADLGAGIIGHLRSTYAKLGHQNNGA